MATPLADTEALLNGGTYAANALEFWQQEKGRPVNLHGGRPRREEGAGWDGGYATGAIVMLGNVLTELFGTSDLAAVQPILGELAVRVAKAKGARKGGLSRSPAKVTATRANAAKARAARKPKGIPPARP